MTNELVKMLDTEDATLWIEYLEDEDHGRRRQALVRLNAFVQRLMRYPAARRDEFAAVVCQAVVDQNVDLPVRHPLLARILFPYLADAYGRRVEQAPRFIAHFYNHLMHWRDGQAWLIERGLTRRLLLTEALARDPADLVTRRELVRVMERQFEYAIHEVPAGVLSGIDGASIDACDAFLEDLAQFRDLVRLEGTLPDYEDALRVWEYHCKAYADYLSHREQYTSYARYLVMHPAP